MNYDNVKKIVDCEIDKIGAKGDMNDADLANLYKLVDIRKDLAEIEEKEMEINGYSQRVMYGIYDDGVTPGESYRGMNSRMRGNSYNNGGYNNNSYRMPVYYGNSMGDGHGSMMDHLNQAMNMAQSDRERDAIRDIMSKM